MDLAVILGGHEKMGWPFTPPLSLLSGYHGGIPVMTIIDWMILMACQPVDGYFMPRGGGIMFFANRLIKYE